MGKLCGIIPAWQSHASTLAEVGTTSKRLLKKDHFISQHTHQPAMSGRIPLLQCLKSQNGSFIYKAPSAS